MNIFRRGRFFLMLAAAVLLGGCATIPRGAVSRQSLSAICQEAGVDFVFDPISLSALLTKNGKRARILVGSPAVTIGSDRILLSAPVVLERQELYVPEDFREQVLCRLDAVFCVSRVRRKSFRIMLDPGHGGKDPGAVSQCGLQEKELVLDIARRVERLLSSAGHDVKLTRLTDVFISLEERTQKATEWGPDIFISIHANASPSDRVVGFEIWTARDLTKEDFADMQREKNQRDLFSRFNMQRRNSLLEKTLEDMMYRHKHKQSLQLANAISRNYVRSLGNRGMKESGFFVLRNTLTPAVLVEIGFLSNNREAQRLKSFPMREEIAEAIAEGVREYIRSL